MTSAVPSKYGAVVQARLATWSRGGESESEAWSASGGSVNAECTVTEVLGMAGATRDIALQRQRRGYAMRAGRLWMSRGGREEWWLLCFLLDYCCNRPPSPVHHGLAGWSTLAQRPRLGLSDDIVIVSPPHLHSPSCAIPPPPTSSPSHHVGDCPHPFLHVSRHCC